MGTSTRASPAAKTKVSGSSRHRRFFTATARYDGARKTMQHGANRATPPAKNAASADPVVSRLPMSTSLSASPSRGRPYAEPLLEERGQLAPRQPAETEERPVEQHQRA